ncbi:MAG TPA: helix-turn-helix domain-containing protein [Candidatus Nanoarchaeia archaeon]|nr:helix-turn-helix domain-containing protein [Candidatus Nanoarchaeia archaeon]
MEKEKLLQQIGLTAMESQTYLALLKSGSLTAGELAKKLKIQRSTAYYILGNLQQRGLVIFALRGKRKLFQAASPHILERQAHETYQKIKEALPELLTSKPAEEKEEALLFTGYKGLQAAYEQMLAESKAGDEMLVLGARGGEDISRVTYRNFYKNFNARRIKRKVNMRVIMNTDLKEKIGGYYKKLPRTKVRYLRQHTLAPIVIFPTAVAIVQWKEEPSLFLLKGSLVKESFKQFFETLWKIAKE